MKITGLRPTIIAKDTASLTKLFTDLGFSVAHEKTDIQGHDDYKNDVMKNDSGDAIYLTQVPGMTNDICAISVNVDDIDEAAKVFEAHGFKNVDGKKQHTGTSVATSFVSPTGIMITVCEHLK